MPVNSATYNFDEILTHTTWAYRNGGEFYDNIFKMTPTWWYLHEKGRKQDWEGSADGRIITNLQYGKNDTVDDYSRYETIRTDPQDNQTAAYDDIKQTGGSITIDRFSIRCNRGKAALKKILKTKISETEMSLSEKVNQDLWQGTPLTSKAINSIPYIVTRAPNSADTDYGGIAADGTGNSWWQNRYKIDTDIDTWAELDLYMLDMYNDCSKGAAKRSSGNKFIGNAPDLLMGNQESHQAYETGMSQRSRYTNPWTEKAASYGFGGLVYKNAIFMWDEMVGDAYTNTYYPTANTEGTIYFLNTNFLYYTVDPGTDMLIEPFVKPTNQDARTALVLHYHQLSCSNRSKQGVLGYINLAIVA